MERKLQANLLQGMDSFLRIASTLRRKELKLKSLSVTTDLNEMELSFNENETSPDKVLNYISKLHDVRNVRFV